MSANNKLVFEYGDNTFEKPYSEPVVPERFHEGKHAHEHDIHDKGKLWMLCKSLGQEISLNNQMTTVLLETHLLPPNM